MINRFNKLTDIYIYIYILMSLLALSLVGCSPSSADDFVVDEVDSNFDFSTLSEVPVKVSSASPHSLVSIFRDREQTKPMFHLMTDASGDYSGAMPLPGALHGETVYLRQGRSVREVKLSSAGVVAQLDAENPDDVPNDNLKLTADQVKTLRRGILGELTEGTDNRHLLNLNNSDISIHTTAEEGTKFMFTFLHTGANVMSRIYYYYYKEGENPTYKELKDKFMTPMYCLTRSLDGNVSGGFIDSQRYLGSNPKYDDKIDDAVSKSVLLMCYDNDSNGSAIFPAGYVVGFFLESYEEDRVRSNFFTESKYNFNHPGPHIKSDYEKLWKNIGRNGGNKDNPDAVANAYDYRHIENPDEPCSIVGPDHWETDLVQAIRYRSVKENCLLYAFEDVPINETAANKYWNWGGGCDFDFNDFVFAITATPEITIETQNLLPDQLQTELEGTLLYEDLFPVEGDYDMNDLIVEYKLTMNYNADDNILTSVDCEFTPKSSSALYHNGLYLVWDVKTETSGSRQQIGPYTIFEDHTAVMGQTIKKTIDLSHLNLNVKEGEFKWKEFNPYIVPRETGYEVHCYNMPPSKAHAASSLYLALDPWQKKYAVHDFKTGIRPYQFAINLTGFRGFSPVTEGVRIDLEYPSYTKWYKSSGAEGKDWYKQKGH